MTDERPLTPQEKFRIVLDLQEFGFAMQRQNFRRRFPHATSDEIDVMMTEWVSTPMGGPEADHPGRKIDWPRRS